MLRLIPCRAYYKNSNERERERERERDLKNRKEESKGW
jgi:hypothetical protein